MDSPQPDRKRHPFPWLLKLPIAAICLALLIWPWPGFFRQLRQDKLNNALLEAAHYRTAADVQKALDQGAGANTREPYGETALMLAAFYGQTDSVKLLLSRGAKVNLACEQGETAFKWAAQNKHFDTMALLRKAGEKQ
ncbi:MAG TPA: ankyrin repeat domain-containing protein [Chthonomonadaceae bacterium]|nr:ankyrin repeat domain-containing protein [Chthonomonadaceae bacterium]